MSDIIVSYLILFHGLVLCKRLQLDGRLLSSWLLYGWD